VPSLIGHIQGILRRDPRVEVFLGTDSQRMGKRNRFITALCFRWNKVGDRYRGAHFIYKSEWRKIHPTVEDKLRYEAQLTVEMYTWLLENMPSLRVHKLEADVSEDPGHVSNRVCDDIKGWLAGMIGSMEQVAVKPEVQVAVKAANQLLQK
jgi:predicted RNase H-related nuclease YkuK (DUF458 family)